MNDISLDITTQEIFNLYDKDVKYVEEQGTLIHAKLAKAFPPDKRSHTLNCSDYNRVFFTSDIHSDLRKFVSMLKENRLMETEIDPYHGDDIYNPKLISDSVWIGEDRTLLVIVGDLVDGTRLFPNGLKKSVDDSIGSFELLLFCLIYNLRRKANREGSEILFTIGNHEYSTILSPNHEYFPYVADTAKKFFGDSDETNLIHRREALLPFLETSPYFMLEFYNGTLPEMACIHGGFHSKGLYLSKYITEIQTLVDNGDSLDSLVEEDDEDISAIVTAGLFSRDYGEAEGPTGYCEALTKDQYPFIVVGHCPTNFTNRTKHLIQTNHHYRGCAIYDSEGDHEDDIGCVILDCRGISGEEAPRLAFVDIAMSQAFRNPTKPYDNKQRPGQMLLLTHDSSHVEERYFNRIDRVAGIKDDFWDSGFPDALLGDTALYIAPPKPEPESMGFVGHPNLTTASRKNRRNRRTRKTIHRRHQQKRKRTRRSRLL